MIHKLFLFSLAFGAFISCYAEGQAGMGEWLLKVMIFSGFLYVLVLYLISKFIIRLFNLRKIKNGLLLGGSALFVILLLGIGLILNIADFIFLTPAFLFADLFLDN